MCGFMEECQEEIKVLKDVLLLLKDTTHRWPQRGSKWKQHLGRGCGTTWNRVQHFDTMAILASVVPKLLKLPNHFQHNNLKDWEFKIKHNFILLPATQCSLVHASGWHCCLGSIWTRAGEYIQVACTFHLLFFAWSTGYSRSRWAEKNVREEQMSPALVNPRLGIQMCWQFSL